MGQSKLFAPLQVGDLKLSNRIVIAPMCQYSAIDGCMTDWHIIHLGQLALSGAALLTIEATAVCPKVEYHTPTVACGRMTTRLAIERTLKSIRRWSDMPIAIQLAHAGRKASTEVPWKGGAHLGPDDKNGWQVFSASAIPYGHSQDLPVALDTDGLKRVRNAFADSAKRSARLGLDAVQIHGAHGYLIHQFLSPLSNHRTDEYGGTLENRMRFPLEVFDAVRSVSGRASCLDARFRNGLGRRGLGYRAVHRLRRSSRSEDAARSTFPAAASRMNRQIPVGPGYQVPLASQIKRAVGIPVVAVGLITEFEQAESILETGEADLIALARGILYDPRWPWHAAAHFGATIRAPNQYLRSQPRQYRDLFEPPRDLD